MIEFAMINDGGSIPSDTTDYTEFLIQQFSLLGLTAYLGNPATNGCPFDFGDFSYTPYSAPTRSFMLTVIHPEMQDSCIVISYRARLTLSSFDGSTINSSIYFGIFTRNNTNTLVATIDTVSANYANYHNWRITTDRCVALKFNTDISVIMGKDIVGFTTRYDKYFFTHYHVPILIPNVTPSDPHYLSINKPVAEYGLAYIAFSLDDIISSQLVELLIQGVTYYSISTQDRKFYCIY